MQFELWQREAAAAESLLRGGTGGDDGAREILFGKELLQLLHYSCRNPLLVFSELHFRKNQNFKNVVKMIRKDNHKTLHKNIGF
jgi:hypothetical protein